MSDEQVRYFIAGMRPAKLVPEGRPLPTCYAFDWKTGEVVPDVGYYSRIVGSKDDIDEVSEEEFNCEVTRLRAELGFK